jgi:hypothetical protein
MLINMIYFTFVTPLLQMKDLQNGDSIQEIQNDFACSAITVQGYSPNVNF